MTEEAQSISFTLNSKSLVAFDGETILQAAQPAGENIPHH